MKATLQDQDQAEVLAELLRRVALAQHDLPDSDDLTAAADRCSWSLTGVSSLNEGAAARLSGLFLELSRATLQEASAVLTRLTDADLLRTFHIQGYTVTGMYAVHHVVEHFAMHYGQILYVTKLLRGEDLGFYRELDKTGRSSLALTRDATP